MNHRPAIVSVYVITHKATGREYIGITTRRPEQRWSQHRCYARKGVDTVIGRALRKYGPDAFAWDVVAECLDLRAAKDAEVWLIAERRPAFNCTSGGDGGQDPAPHVRQKMRAKALGRVRSEETRARMSAAKKLLWQDPAHRERIAEKMRARVAADGGMQLRRAAELGRAALRSKFGPDELRAIRSRDAIISNATRRGEILLWL